MYGRIEESNHKESSANILYKNTTKKEAEIKYRNKLLNILGDTLSPAEVLYSTINELENKIIEIDKKNNSESNYIQQNYNAINSFKRNYSDIKEADTINADKYFHAKANCQAAQYGKNSALTAQTLSNIREDVDLLKNKYKKKKDGSKMTKQERIDDYVEDKMANLYGRMQGYNNPYIDCKVLVDKYRPNGLDEKY